MIRINLLPVRQKAIRQYGKQQLLLGILLVGVEIAVLYSMYSGRQEVLDQEQQAADELQAQVDELNRQNDVIAELNSQKEDLESLGNILGDLEANRAGPVQVMDELKEMLNPPANDLQRVAQDRRGWNTSWQPNHLWLSTFDESSGNVRIAGKGLTNDDIAEFTVRLASSPYFTSVQLQNTSAGSETGVGAVFSFQIEARVNYGLVTTGEES